MDVTVKQHNSRPWLCFIFVVFSVIIGATTWMTPIEFDGAFNFQIAKSLQEDFSYQTRYVPTKIYHDKVTTNGPIQYFMAAMIGLFDLDPGRSIALGCIAGLAAITIFLYSRQSFVLYCLLLLFWPVFAWAHINFWGEIFTVTMVMAGIMSWENWVNKFIAHDSVQVSMFLTLHSPHLWLSGLAFGAAIATKLFAAPSILLLICCLSVYTAEGHLAITTISRPRIFLIGAWLVFPCIIAFIIFMLQFSASILHSGEHLYSIWPILKMFISQHFQQASGATALKSSLLMASGKEIPTLFVLLTCLLFLSYRHFVFFIAGVLIAVLFFVGHLNLRRLMPLIVPIMLFGSQEVLAHRDQRFGNFRHLQVLVLSTILIGGAFFTNNYAQTFVHSLKRFTLSGAEIIAEIGSPTPSNSHYDRTLIPIIKALPGRVFTSRWWQFPEISLRSGTVFHNRFAPENSLLLLDSRKSFLLFSSNNNEDHTTEQDLCGDIIYREGPLILCEYRAQ